MGFRFGKSIRLGKFIRLNISKSGLGMSAGVKGIRVGVGPRGTRLTTSIPGTGISYSKQLGGKSRGARRGSSVKAQRINYSPPLSMPQALSPSLLAPQHEKDFVQGIKDYQAGHTEAALHRFSAAGQKDAGGGLYAAVLLATRQGCELQAIAWLESIVRADLEFPTPLMKKYQIKGALKISITPSVIATVPLDGLGAALLLAELYQKQNRLEEAIGVLEEVEEIAGEPAVTLSLCELYAHRALWDGVVDRARGCVVVDDVTLETAILHGRALQEKGLHDAAIDVFTGALRGKKNRSLQLLNEGQYWRAISYEITGKKSQANKEFQKLYAHAADFRDVAQRVANIPMSPNPTVTSIRKQTNDVLPSTKRIPTLYCGVCGSPTRQGHVFCGQCGTSI